MNRRGGLPILALLAAGLSSLGCSASTSSTVGRGTLRRVVVTSPVLGAVAKQVVGEAADVVVLMPNGADPHEWNPSAKDIAQILGADLVVENGLGLEGRLQAPLRQARSNGVQVFTVADHVTVRAVGEGEGTNADDPDQAPGAADPHLWMDPLTMKQWIDPFVSALAAVGVDAQANAATVESQLDELNSDVADILDRVPPERRRLVTGHESMGYFAARYGFELIGAVVPSLTTQAEPSAGELADLTSQIRKADVPAVFAEIGTPRATTAAVAGDTHAKVVELSTHNLPADGTYRSFMIDIATTVATALS